MSITIRCRKCGDEGQVSEKRAGATIKCRQCGEPMRVPPAVPREDEVELMEEGGAGAGGNTKVFLFVGFAFLVLVIGLMLPDRPERKAEREREDAAEKQEREQSERKGEAWVMAQQFVKDKLKSPGTADFGWLQTSEDTVQDLGGGKYRIRGWVDSQNTFGATVRTRFVCELKHAGGDRWELEGIVFDE